MPNDAERAIIQDAIAETAEMSRRETDGKWLERVTVETAPFIREWDVQDAWLWADWPERARRFPNTTNLDVGIDAVAVRRSDGAHIAIQCKARRLNDDWRGYSINAAEIAKFAAASAGSLWAEIWIVTNGENPLASGARLSDSMRDNHVKWVNIAADLESERASWASEDEYCAHCERADDADAIQTKSCMQREAISTSVRVLREHERSDSGGTPVGEARGRIILPCGTGKTRISLRIVERLTPPGDVSVVLCPSIALVAQIRREYLQHAESALDVLAVCSDATAGYDAKREGVRNLSENPTIDASNVSANEVKGRVTTDADEIADWMRQPALDSSTIKVLIGTYQSSARVSEALEKAGVRARVLIADEAHRTAGLKRKNSRSAKASADEKRVRDFTICHDSERFPATYRVYQTATPRIYDGKRPVGNPNWIVRSMDDESTFGVELYRKSYVEAVNNEWLADYRIIALGVNDPDAYAVANTLARDTKSSGRRKLTTVDYMRGLAFALAMGGATQGGGDDEDADIRSCIAFMNTVDKSKNMARDLQSDDVRQWVAKYLRDNANGRAVSDYRLEHLDASSNAAARDTAKTRLAGADSANPRGVINVGIFGEGTDSPSLSAVAFLEARKSPIDVVQAVGRAMRTAPGKTRGYIICPILFPPAADPEKWLANASPDEGWQELGQILLALRAHDSRIEDKLADLLHIYPPKAPEPPEICVLAIADADSESVRYYEHVGAKDEAEDAAERMMMNGASAEEVGARGIQESGAPCEYEEDEPTRIVVGKKNADGGGEIRTASVARDKPKAGAARGAANIEKTKKKALDIINGATDAHLYKIIPPPPPPERCVIVVADADTDGESVRYAEFNGLPADAVKAAERMLNGALAKDVGARTIDESAAPYEEGDEPARILVGKKDDEGNAEIRADDVARGEPNPADGETRGAFDMAQTVNRARTIIETGEGGTVVRKSAKRKTGGENGEKKQRHQIPLKLDWMDDYGNAIRMNLLTKSGLSGNRVARDLNILRESVDEAAHHLRADGLLPALNRHFGMDRLKKTDKKSADGCAVAALLMMNAAMLHQRIAAGGWLSGVRDMSQIKNDKDVTETILSQWGVIMRRDFLPVLEPAEEAVKAVKETGKLAGLERALRHIAAEAERIAETYADMGADYAGELFNKVMGNQASDGAYFTRPVAASLAARLTLDACEESGETDWRNPAVWRAHKTLDPACGSGTLLAAALAEMKRRAKDAGASADELAELQKLAVEEVLNGLDINPVSLQLAASQLTAGDSRISYRRMGLHLMPYGPDRHNPAKISAGTLELLGQRAIVSRNDQLNIASPSISSQPIWGAATDAELEDAVDAARNARIVIMNPPYTNRVKMGEKFPPETQRALRERADAMEQTLVRSDRTLEDFVDKSSIRPLFTALADKCVRRENGVLTMIIPTVALTAPSGIDERRILAQRWHIHTIMTCHDPKQVNLSQNTGINESIAVMRRHDGVKPPTRFINLDRLPTDESEVADFHRQLDITGGGNGILANGWGEVSFWDSERIEAGDWTPAIWRSPELADAAARFANDESMQTLRQVELSPQRTDLAVTVSFEIAATDEPGSFPILSSKGANSQTRIQSRPDEYRIPKNRDERIREANGGTYPESDKFLRKAGRLLITAGQDNSSGRLTATADDAAYVGRGWLPVAGLSAPEAKALAVFINSTAGRLQLMRNQGRKLAYPIYRPAGIGNIRIPNIKDARIRETLAACWERTRAMVVPQFRDGDCEIRRLWDEAVADAMGWDADELANLRALLCREPHVRGLGYGQFGG